MKNEAELSIVGNDANRSTPPPKRKLPPPQVRPKPAKVLPSQRIAFDKQLDILRAYAAASGPSCTPVSSEQVSKIVGMAESSFPLVNPFFCDVGFIQKIEQKG